MHKLAEIAPNDKRVAKAVRKNLKSSNNDTRKHAEIVLKYLEDPQKKKPVVPVTAPEKRGCFSMFLDLFSNPIGISNL